MIRNSENTETITKQGDKMTIHNNDRGSQWKNLNNIVRSDNPNQVYKSSESDQNNTVNVQGVGLGSKKQSSAKSDEDGGRVKPVSNFGAQQDTAANLEEQKQLRVIILHINY